MGAISIEKGKVQHCSKDEKMEKWKYQAFLAAYSRLNSALMFSLTLPILALFVIFSTPFICIKFNATHKVDWFRMGLSLVPHLVLSIDIIYRTLPILCRPVLNKQKWSRLAENMKGKAVCANFLYIFVYFLTCLDLSKLYELDSSLFSDDECRRCVGILVNWIASLLLTLLTVRVNYDQTRVALSLEALEILEWTGQKDGSCTAQITKSVMKSYCDQMNKIYELLCLGMTVTDMTAAYLTLMVIIDISIIYKSFVIFYINFDLIPLAICLFFISHFLSSLLALVETTAKKISIGTIFIIFCQIFFTGLVAYFLYSDPDLKEFVLRSIRYWNGQSQPLSVPNTMWDKDWKYNFTRPMATGSMGVILMSLLSLYLLHSIYTFFSYVINQRHVDSAKDKKAKAQEVLV